MPIVTAAIVAVAAAVATTTVATVATAAIAVGTLVGTVGLGVSVIGMATGNKTLTKIGGYLGMAGGVMSVAGGLAGGLAGYSKILSSAWDDGVGSLFSGTKPVGQQALGSAGLSPKTAAPVQQAVPTEVAPSVSTQAPPAAAAQPSVTAPASGTGQAGVNPMDFVSGKAGVPGPNMAATQFANAGQNAAPLSTEGLASATAQANAAPTVGAEGLRQEALGQGIVAASKGVPPAASSGGIGSFFSGLPDWAKAQVAISGAQSLAGMAGGWFQGASAEEKLALEREAQAWQMQHNDSIKNFNQRNASYAPTVKFTGNGLLNKGANS